MTTATTWRDTGAHCGFSEPSLPGGGPAGMRNGMLWGNAIVLNNETLSASPRMAQNVLVPGALTTTWTISTWTPDKSVTITRMQAQAKKAPSGSHTNAVIQTSDRVKGINLMIATAANDSGAISQTYSGGTPITISIQTAASGCSTPPADVNITLQYKMQ